MEIENNCVWRPQLLQCVASCDPYHITGYLTLLTGKLHNHDAFAIGIDKAEVLNGVENIPELNSYDGGDMTIQITTFVTIRSLLVYELDKSR